MSVETRLSEYSLSSEDIADALGYETADFECRQCSGCFCSHKVIKAVDGEPVIFCTMRQAARDVLAWAGEQGK